MKEKILLIILIFPSLMVDGQNGTFKKKIKSPSGTAPRSIEFIQINGNNHLKSTNTVSTYQLSASLQHPMINQDDKPIKEIIFKGNSPVYIEREASRLKSSANITAEDKFYSFLETTKSITKIADPDKSFKIADIQTDKLGITHIRTIQLYKGIEIYGSGSIFHFDNEKERFTGRIHHISQDIEIIPQYSEDEVIQKVNADLKKITVFKEFSVKEKELLRYHYPVCKKVIYKQDDHQSILAYEIDIRPNFIEEWKYFVDAASGKIIRKFNNTKSDGPTIATGYDLNNQLRTFDVYLEQGTYYLYNSSEDIYNDTTEEGIIVTLDANHTSTANLDYSYVTSSNNSWTQKAAISAHYHATRAYEYFYSTFGRSSINGQGGNIISFVNVAEDDGSSMENAFWNGQAVFYGNGGVHFKPLAGALDVAAHELGHGVVSNTANLEYYGQSGAINESYADIFGSMVDREDWLIGEDIVNPDYFPLGTLRNMADPHNGYDKNNPNWQPANVSEMYLGEEDNSGVHINNSIGSHAYYLFATAIGKDKAEQVFYRALAEYLTNTSQFIDFRIAVIQSAKDLYGNDSQEATEASKAFDAVGIHEEEQIEYTQDYPVNPGQDYLLSYDTDLMNSNTLYRSSVEGSNFYDLTTTEMKGKVSVTDDGSAAVFISGDDEMRVIYLDPQNTNEDIISNDAWDNVAISKDGNRVAAISTEVDTAIWVYDFISEKWAKFKLYNPTTSHSNTSAGGVLFADAIEFDHTGEYIIYDAYNVFNSSTSDDIYYWDIGFIKVWDNVSNKFGDGTIAKLFSSLPEDVSIGNPVFSKNSPYIIAFDYLDSYNDDYAIFGANLNTGDVEVIYVNSTLGYPSFSRLDDKIAFSAIDIYDNEVVATINLASDKITGTGDAALLIDDAKWPVYYATGERILGLAPMSNFTVDLKTGKAPLKVQFLDLSTNNPNAWSWTFEGGTPPTSSQQNPVITYNTPGTYRVQLTASNSYGNNTNTKTEYILVTLYSEVSESDIRVVSFYPNPVTDILNIECDNGFSVKLFNIQGKMILDVENQDQINLSDIKSGIYILEVKTGNEIFRNKLMKH